MRPLLTMLTANRGVANVDATVGAGGMPEIDTGACLGLAVIASSTTEANFCGFLSTVEA